MPTSLRATFRAPPHLSFLIAGALLVGCSSGDSKEGSGDGDAGQGTNTGGWSGNGDSPSSGGAGETGLGAGGTGELGTGGLNPGGAGGLGSGGLGSEGPGSGGLGSGGLGSGGEGTGGDGTGGAVGSNDDPIFPAPGATNVCPDPSLRLRFDAPPTLGTSGNIRVYDAANPGNPVATIDLGSGGVSVSAGGNDFSQPRPAYVHENEAIFLLPSEAIDFNKTYYVTMDSGVVLGVEAIDDPNEWRFSTLAAPPNDRSTLRVAVNGTGQYCSLQGAIDASTTGTHISIAPGAYYGIVYFRNKDGLSLVGDDRDSTIITGVNNNNLNPSTRGRALVGLEHVTDLTIESLTIENQTPQGGSQAEALAMLDCDRCIVRDSTVKSLQDTLLWEGRIYAENCLIEGNVDYIWGRGTVYFNQCEIKTVGRSGYNLQARNGSGYGYVFVDSKLTSDPGITGDVLARIDVTQYPESHVAYIDCEMGGHISPEGWRITGGGSTANLRFWEYRSRTPGGNLVNTSGRAAGSRQISDAEAAQMRDPTVVLSGWDPTQ